MNIFELPFVYEHTQSILNYANAFVCDDHADFYGQFFFLFIVWEQLERMCWMCITFSLYRSVSENSVSCKHSCWKNVFRSILQKRTFFLSDGDRTHSCRSHFKFAFVEWNGWWERIFSPCFIFFESSFHFSVALIYFYLLRYGLL